MGSERGWFGLFSLPQVDRSFAAPNYNPDQPTRLQFSPSAHAFYLYTAKSRPLPQRRSRICHENLHLTRISDVETFMTVISALTATASEVRMGPSGTEHAQSTGSQLLGSWSVDCGQFCPGVPSIAKGGAVLSARRGPYPQEWSAHLSPPTTSPFCVARLPTSSALSVSRGVSFVAFVDSDWRLGTVQDARKPQLRAGSPETSLRVQLRCSNPGGNFGNCAISPQM